MQEYSVLLLRTDYEVHTQHAHLRSIWVCFLQESIAFISMRLAPQYRHGEEREAKPVTTYEVFIPERRVPYEVLSADYEVLSNRIQTEYQSIRHTLLRAFLQACLRISSLSTYSLLLPPMPLADCPIKRVRFVSHAVAVPGYHHTLTAYKVQDTASSTTYTPELCSETKVPAPAHWSDCEA